MLREMPFPQLVEWMAFDTLEPIGGHRGDWQAASVSATMMNATAMRAGISTRFRPKDFLLEFDKPVKDDVITPAPSAPPARTWQEMRHIARMQVAIANADMQKRKKRNG